MEKSSKASMIRRWLKALPEPVSSVVRESWYAVYRGYVKARCRRLDWLEAFRSRDALIPPAMLRYRVSQSTDVRKFLEVGNNCALTVRQSLRAAGAPLEGLEPVLDFGCGCGRVLAALLREFPGKQFFGTDVDGEAIDWCGRNFHNARFTVNQWQPPLPYENEFFELIYGISVFTHLAEEQQRAWLRELHRVLRPNGVLLLTFHGPDAWHILDHRDVATLKSQGVLYRASTKLRGLCPDWYQTTFHTPDCVMSMLESHFAVLRYERGGLGMQDVVVARRSGAPA
jgi:SAM-dependent methyltransferase